MIHLTTEEKASRYDSLQVALEFSRKNYQRRQHDAEIRYRGGDTISAYNKGLTDAYASILEDLERWCET